MNDSKFLFTLNEIYNATNAFSLYREELQKYAALKDFLEAL